MKIDMTEDFTKFLDLVGETAFYESDYSKEGKRKLQSLKDKIKNIEKKLDIKIENDPTRNP